MMESILHMALMFLGALLVVVLVALFIASDGASRFLFLAGIILLMFWSSKL